MGWSIGVGTHTVFAAYCHEIGCTDTFPERSTWSEAEYDVIEHRRKHQKHWEHVQARWDEQQKDQG